VSEPLLTCEPVLAETAFHLRSVPVVTSMMRRKVIALAFSVEDHLDELDWLASRYGDRQPDLAEICLIGMSELYPRHQVVTVDRDDFRNYRRNRREAIPLIYPAQLDA
jgi:hypothetical protein